MKSTIGYLLHAYKNLAYCPATILNDEVISVGPEFHNFKDDEDYQMRCGLDKKNIWKNKSLFSLYKKAHTPYSWHKDIFKIANKFFIRKTKK